MDKNYIASRLKKYLFLISIIFIMLTSSHLLYSYMYSDAKETAIKWWSISEAIIWNIPNLNPLRSNNQQNKYINSILYRSLLKYDPSKKKIVWDLAKCNISNLLEIECYLNQNIKWSNGEAISIDDVVQTYETLKKTSINKNMFALLQNVTITKTDTSILFKNNKKDINILRMFFQPIVSSKVLNIISKKEIEWSFSLANWVYSWVYKVNSIVKDDTFNMTSVTLEKNEEYNKNPVYIDLIVFKVFPTVKDFLKNKNSINIFNDKDNLITGTIPSLKTYQYTLPQYTSVFINTQKIKDNDLRGLILNKIEPEKIVNDLWENKFEIIQNHYLSDAYIEEKPITTSISGILNKKWYYNQWALVKKLEGDLNKIKKFDTKPEEISTTGSTLPWDSIKKENEESVTKPVEEKKIISWEAITNKNPQQEEVIKESIPKNAPSEIITSPNWVEKFNFITKDNILLQGKVPAWTSSVFIWDYKLKNYKAWDSTFFYRIKQTFSNINVWDNTYKIYAVVNWEKKLLEELYFFFNTDTAITKEKKDWMFSIAKDTNSLAPQKKESSSTWSISQTWSTINSEYIEAEKKIKTLQKKNSQFYYNDSGEPYTLELYYISEKPDYEIAAENIKKSLEEEWIKVHLSGITTSDLTTLLSEWKKNYDMLLTWINLWYFDFDIYPYFHSSQIESRSNYANFRKLDLDILLEDLRNQVLSEEKINTQEKKVLSIISNNNLSKTIYTPILSNLVDKNIKWYSLQKRIPEKIYRFAPLKKSYIKENKFINTENKDITWYFIFLKNLLFSS